MSAFLLSILGILTATNAKNQIMDLTLLPPNLEGGLCLDGSPSGFYYSPPPNDVNSSLWVIHLDGGGACSTKSSCMDRANSSKGSSNYWSKTRAGSNEWSDDPVTNPDFYMAHHVVIPYCTGDVHLGQITTPTPQTWGLYFSGHLNFVHIIGHLFNNMSLLSAKYVLLTGNSAGGNGVFGNYNWFYQHLKANAVSADIVIKAAPMSGWFFPGNDTIDQPNDPEMPPNDYPHWVQNENGGSGHDPALNQLWDTYLIPECVSALGPKKSWHCSSVHNMYPFLTGPIFVMENKYDKNQIVDEMLMPINPVTNESIGYVEYYGLDMENSIKTRIIHVKNETNGVYFASCFDHGVGLGIGLQNSP
eukprot:746629_1